VYESVIRVYIRTDDNSKKLPQADELFDMIKEHTYEDFKIDESPKLKEHIKLVSVNNSEIHFHTIKDGYFFGFGIDSENSKVTKEADTILNKILNFLSITPSAKTSKVEIDSEFDIEDSSFPFDSIINKQATLEVVEKTGVRLSPSGVSFETESNGMHFLFIAFQERSHKKGQSNTLLSHKDTDLYEHNIINGTYDAALRFERQIKLAKSVSVS
jgi:hypothetical protein